MAHDIHQQHHSAKTIFFVGLTGLILYSLVTLATLYFGEKGVVTSDETRAKDRLEKRLKIQEEGEKKLSSYGWADKGKGQIHIPINQAMELELPVLKQREVLNK